MRRINKYLRTKYGITDEDKVFYSFRHTFINYYLKQNDFERSMCKQIVGHSDKDITFSLYGKTYPVEKVYQDVILKVDFGVDLEHLKSSRWVG